MARPRSARVIELKAALSARLRHGVVQPGGRFLSARALAQRFDVSYQTAHRLLSELHDEGLIRRVPASGTFLPGLQTVLRGVQFIFHSRARRKGSFGHHLLDLLKSALQSRGIAWSCHWPDHDAAPRLRRGFIPVIWECRAAARAAALDHRFALVLNDLPPPGSAGGFIDAITTDDYSGGACAAELLKARTGRSGGFAVLGGPPGDPRSERRIEGFQAHVRSSRVHHAASWYREAGLARAWDILREAPAGIFACNDRLAEALILACRMRRLPLPPLVGFDNAPIAEHLRLTTIGIPWSELVQQSMHLVEGRLHGSTSPGRLLCLAHEMIVRLTCENRLQSANSRP